MPILTSDIIGFCQTFLKTDSFDDYCINGLHVEGNPQCERIAFGVTASKNFLEKASEWKANLSIVHHGLIFKKIPVINDILAERLKILFQANMSLAGFHLPLDAHPKVGNNIAIAEGLGLENIFPKDIGFVGDLPSPISFPHFLEKIEILFGAKPIFSGAFHGEKVSRVLVISGGASDYSHHAVEASADTFLFGELQESSYHEIRERNLNFVACGHYSTERFGVQRLEKAIQEKFPEIETAFFEEECPV
jgi:dinuclear metal center YbgI/SA1388 family protein